MTYVGGVSARKLHLLLRQRRESRLAEQPSCRPKRSGHGLLGGTSPDHIVATCGAAKTDGETSDGAAAAVVEDVEVGKRLLVRRARLHVRGGPNATAIWAPGVWLRSRRLLLSVVLDARPRLPVRVESSLVLTTLAFLDHRALQRLRHAHARAAGAHHDDAQLLDRLGRLALHPERAEHCARTRPNEGRGRVRRGEWQPCLRQAGLLLERSSTNAGLLLVCSPSKRERERGRESSKGSGAPPASTVAPVPWMSSLKQR